MANLPSGEEVSRAVGAARRYLSESDAAKIESIARDPAALEKLTAGMSGKDWTNVMRILNDPVWLQRVLSSSKGQAGIRDFLNRIP